MEPSVVDFAQLPLVFLGGLLGSSHCIGMCGGFAMAVGYGSESVRENIRRQALWSTGRIFTYTFGGAVCGYLGARLQGRFSFTSFQGALAIAAGVLLIIQGVLASGLVKRRFKPKKHCSIGKWSGLLPIGRLLRPTVDAPARTHSLETFLAGVMTGFLPCGLVYAYLALATASGSLAWGAVTMVVFGLGTIPIMIATGVGVSLMSLTARTRLFKVAAWCVLITGVLTITRGVAAIQAPGAGAKETSPSCPLCNEPPTPPSIQSEQGL